MADTVFDRINGRGISLTKTHGMISYLNQISSLPSLLHHPQAAREEIVAFQNRQLRRLVAHAYHNVPYYRGLFDRSGVKPQDIQSVADLSAIPITSRKDLQALSPNEIVARGLDAMQLINHKTSGRPAHRSRSGGLGLRNACSDCSGSALCIASGCEFRISKQRYFLFGRRILEITNFCLGCYKNRASTGRPISIAFNRPRKLCGH